MDLLGGILNIAKSTSPSFQLLDIGRAITGIDVHQLASQVNPTIANAIGIGETIQGGAILASGLAAGAALAAPALAGFGGFGALSKNVAAPLLSAARDLPSTIGSISTDFQEDTGLNTTPQDVAYDDLDFGDN
jgi:hypothetical protein